MAQRWNILSLRQRGENIKPSPHTLPSILLLLPKGHQVAYAATTEENKKDQHHTSATASAHVDQRLPELLHAILLALGNLGACRSILGDKVAEVLRNIAMAPLRK